MKRFISDFFFSPDIKAAVDDSMELCGQIRSERFKVARELKTEAAVLSNLQGDLQAIQEKLNKTDENTPSADGADKKMIPNQIVNQLILLSLRKSKS